MKDNSERTLFADFHIHIGRSAGKPVKMAAAPSLTLEAVVEHARNEKGLDVITVIDGVCTNVLAEITEHVRDGRLTPMPGGGLLCSNGLVLLIGSEVEVRGPHGGAAHFGCWFGSLEAAADFSRFLQTVQRNASLSSQLARVDAQQLAVETSAREGLFVVHHAFTPHKGLYGNCVDRMSDMVDPMLVSALELGLSADSDMADCLTELSDITFLTNSDAHSLPKIAREYNAISMRDGSFEEVKKALSRREGRSIQANYGLKPELGKYRRTRCEKCGLPVQDGATTCPCGSSRFTMGVYDRLLEIRDVEVPVHPSHRPPYIPQVPLEYVPGLGPKSLRRLLDAFGTEMDVLHRASLAEIEQVVGEPLAARIELARRGNVQFIEGGGGVYGHIEF